MAKGKNLTTIGSCPRCHASVQPEAVSCSRCGLSLVTPTGVAPPPESALPVEMLAGAQAPASPSGRFNPLTQDLNTGILAPLKDTGPLPATTDPRSVSTGPLGAEPPAYLSSTPSLSTGPLSTTPNLYGQVGLTGNTGPLLHIGPLRTGPLNASVLAAGAAPGRERGAAVPRGALELLPQETVAYQLGALYLTTKRVILLAPSVIRSAFIRDIDAVGTFTERASGWYLFAGLLLLALASGMVYASVVRDAGNLSETFPFLYVIEPWIVAVALLLGAIALLVRYFFHIKRTLFVSVKGRPLITVSIADWNTSRLDGMDTFVNSFFQIKDFISGELNERRVE